MSEMFYVPEGPVDQAIPVEARIAALTQLRDRIDSQILHLRLTHAANADPHYAPNLQNARVQGDPNTED